MSREEREYQEWLAAIADECDCCSECSPTVCGGVQQGGFCDRLCWCWCDEGDDEGDEL